jgi:hypothetical protein
MAGDADALDALILECVAAHDFVILSQIEVAGGEAGEEAASRQSVARLSRAGLVRAAPRMRWQRGAYQVTRVGLDRLGSAMPEPVVDLRRYWEHQGLGWLWVHARHRAVFGKVDAVYSEREMRAADLTSGRALDDQRLSAPLRAKLTSAAFGMTTRTEVHYPGLVLVIPQGRVVMEVMLSAPPQRWIDELLDGVAATPQVAAVIMLGPSFEILAGVRETVEHRGLAHLVQFQKLKMVYDST